MLQDRPQKNVCSGFPDVLLLLILVLLLPDLNCVLIKLIIKRTQKQRFGVFQPTAQGRKLLAVAVIVAATAVVIVVAANVAFVVIQRGGRPGKLGSVNLKSKTTFMRVIRGIKK